MGEKIMKKHPILSVIIPVYNEKDYIAECIKMVKSETKDKLLNFKITKQIIVVDDGSTDGSWDIIKKFKGIKKIRHEKNKGKGAGIKTALPHCIGKYTIIQDADSEYKSSDYPLMLYPASIGFKAIIGSRRMNPHNECNRNSKFSFFLGGNILTWFANTLYGTHVNDWWCGYKCIDTKLLKSLDLQSDGFETCAETVAKLAKRKVSMYNIPVFYYPRVKGKKIKWKDGLKLAWCLIEQKWFKK